MPYQPTSPSHNSMTTSTPTSPRVPSLPPMVLPLPMIPLPVTQLPSIHPPPNPTTSIRGAKRRTSETTADAREHHRRLSHSAIEKRRRERINDKIDQLKYLIPSCCPTEPTLLPSASMHQPLHKLSVLQAAIDYIQQLHLQLVQQAPLISSLPHRSDKELDMVLSHARRQQPSTPASSP